MTNIRAPGNRFTPTWENRVEGGEDVIFRRSSPESTNKKLIGDRQRPAAVVTAGRREEIGPSKGVDQCGQRVAAMVGGGMYGAGR